MESHVQRPIVGSTVTTRPDQKDSWIAVAGRIPARTQTLSRWRTLFSCSVPSIRLGVHASSRQGSKCYGQNWCGLRSAHSENILSRAGLTSPQKKRKSITPCSEPFSMVTGPNQLWCMDFKGYFVTGDGKRCDPFTITDAYSRYLIRCQIVSRIDLSQVRAICEAAMREYGMPARIRTDNGAPFSGTGLMGLSKLALGWMKLGIVHERIQAGRPQQNGRHERMHRTLKEDTTKPPASSLRAQQNRFDNFRYVFNNERPHEGLKNAVPASLYYPSSVRLPRKLPEFTYPKGLLLRKVNNSGDISWHKTRIFISEVFRFEELALELTTPGFYRVYFRDLEVGELNAEELRFRAARRVVRASMSASACYRQLKFEMPNVRQSAAHRSAMFVLPGGVQAACLQSLQTSQCPGDYPACASRAPRPEPT